MTRAIQTPTVEAPLSTNVHSLPSHRRIDETLITACSFVACLSLFFAFTVARFSPGRIALDENRMSAELPQLPSTWTSACSFPQSFEKYFNDRFALRSRLVSLRTLLLLKLFNLPGSRYVLAGKDGFFFYADRVNLPMILGNQPFTITELNSWKSLLERRHSSCKSKGINYFFVIAPAKSSIYPELLPAGYENLAKRTRTDELIDFLKQTGCPVPVIDLRPPVRSSKGSMPLYLRTDTHWNQLGTYYGYQSMINYLHAFHPSIGTPLALSECVIKPYIFKKGDLARAQGLLGSLVEENIALNRRVPQKATMFKYPVVDSKPTSADVLPFGYEQNGSRAPKAVMFRDSFACYMAELFLADHFSRIVFFWQPQFDEGIVKKEKPNLVIQEMLETGLYESPPDM